MKNAKKPVPGKFYYINYEDKAEPEGSYFGIAECVQAFNYSESGEPLNPPLYEFKHPDKDGKMTLSVFYPNEIILETN